MDRRVALLDLTRLFLRLGTVAFGGPAAHIAMFREEVVVRRRWMTEQRFLDLMGATNLIPGPNSTEMAIHIGYERGGWRGLIVAGASFILLASILVGVIAWAYVEFQEAPALEWILYGIKPVVVAIIVNALFGLGPTAFKTWRLMALGLGGLGLFLAGVNELAILFGGGLLIAIIRLSRSRPGGGRGVGGLFAPAFLIHAATHAAVALPGLGQIFITFARFGAVIYRKRLRSIAVHEQRACGETWLAYGAAASRGHRNRSGDTRSRFHHRHLRRVPAGRGAGSHRGNPGDFPAVVRICWRAKSSCATDSRS